jgi:hypothetical protein
MLATCIQSDDPDLKAVLEQTLLTSSDEGFIAAAMCRLLAIKAPLIQCAVVQLVAGLAALDSRGSLALGEGHLPGFLMCVNHTTKLSFERVPNLLCQWFS